VGHWLRRLSLDEFPQLINVIRGEMSLVGPRPHALAHDKHYAALIENYELRQHVKPGMTGWAQVNGLRGPTGTPELMRRRVELDIWYATNASIGLDVKILLLTAVEVFRQRNAH
jgi:lipopolysaccharide/colanic/teichoic acid biosynthesis glycosyltransferase